MQVLHYEDQEPLQNVYLKIEKRFLKFTKHDVLVNFIKSLLE